MTSEEARDLIIQSARDAAWYWTTQVGDIPPEKRVTGALFTFLADLDGVGSLPACDIMVLESDFETGEKIAETRVSTMLHEFFYEGWEEKRPG